MIKAPKWSHISYVMDQGTTELRDLIVELVMRKDFLLFLGDREQSWLFVRVFAVFLGPYGFIGILDQHISSYDITV